MANLIRNLKDAKPGIIKQVGNAYKAGGTYISIETDFGVSRSIVPLILDQIGIPRRPPGMTLVDGVLVKSFSLPSTKAKAVTARAAVMKTRAQRQRKNVNQQAWRAKRRAEAAAVVPAAPVAKPATVEELRERKNARQRAWRARFAAAKKAAKAKTTPATTKVSVIPPAQASTGHTLLRTLYDGGQITKSDIVAFAAIVLAA